MDLETTHGTHIPLLLVFKTSPLPLGLLLHTWCSRWDSNSHVTKDNSFWNCRGCHYTTRAYYDPRVANSQIITLCTKLEVVYTSRCPWWESNSLLPLRAYNINRFTMRSRHDCLTTLTSPALLSSSVNLGGEGWIRTSVALQVTCALNLIRIYHSESRAPANSSQ